MKVTVENFRAYAENAIKKSILALGDVKEIIQFYGDAKECTIDTYFASQIKGGVIYDSTDEMDECTFIGEISSNNLEIDFEDAREKVFREWFRGLVDEADGGKNSYLKST